MNMQRPDENIQASVLDRLIGDDLTSGRHAFRTARACVMRDIENLLNTKKNILPLPKAYHNLEKSLFTYGVKDFTHENAKSLTALRRMLKEIKRTVEIFEPRLKRVQITLDQNAANDRFQFKISGVLVVDPISEPVTFDTHMDSKRGKYVIEK